MGPDHGQRQHDNSCVIPTEKKIPKKRRSSSQRQEDVRDLEEGEEMAKSKRSAMRRRKVFRLPTPLTALLAISSTIPTARAQNCVSLSGSTQCPAFNASSVSTGLTSLLSVNHPKRSSMCGGTNLLQSVPCLRFQHTAIRPTIEPVHSFYICPNYVSIDLSSRKLRTAQLTWSLIDTSSFSAAIM